MSGHNSVLGAIVVYLTIANCCAITNPDLSKSGEELAAHALTWPVRTVRYLIRGTPRFFCVSPSFLKLVWKEAWR